MEEEKKEFKTGGKLEFNNYDLCIRETTKGDEYVAFTNGFNSSFVEAMRSFGVEKVIPREETEENDDK